MEKIVYIGTAQIEGNTGRDGNSAMHAAKVFAKISYKDERLSISGVVGPRSNGDAWGSCGQIDDTIREHRMDAEHWSYAPGWSPIMLDDFLNVWRDWHLNDMRPYCEHQKAAGYAKLAQEKINIYHWRLKPEYSAQKKEIEEAAMDELKKAATVSIKQGEASILALAYSLETPTEDPGATIRHFYAPATGIQGEHVETKTRGWITYEEDRRGLLGKPCEVCGYKYGSEWKHEALPAEALAFLEALPVSEVTPAWV